MRKGHSGKTAQVPRQFDCLALGQVHQRRVNDDIAFHADAQRILQCPNGLLATIRVTTVVGLSDTRHEVTYPALVRKSGREGQEDEVPTGHKGIGQTVVGGCRAFNLDVAIRQRISAECCKRVDWQACVTYSRVRRNSGRAFDFDSMPLAIVERYC